MNCAEWEERLALYAGDDLPETARLEVERHLAECPGCQIFASDLKQSMAWMQESHAEAPTAADIAVVRTRVMEQLEAERRPLWRWRWAWPLAAACAAVVLLLELAPWSQRTEVARVAVNRPPEVAPVGRTPRSAAGPQTGPVARRRIRPRRTVPAVTQATLHKPEPAEPVTIKMLTDDPDVVIYWIANKGDLQ